MATAKGERRRAAVVAAAARLVLADGPAGVTHRRVAEAADVPLAATTYYFSGRDDLLAAAGERIVDSWVVAAERVAQRAQERAGDAEDAVQTGAGEAARAYGGLVDDLLAALLPPKVGEIRGHYEHLVAAGRDKALARAYRAGRTQLDAATAKILAAHGVSVPPDLVLALLDGSVVTALSEGRQVRAHARDTLLRALPTLGGPDREVTRGGCAATGTGHT